MAGIKRAGRIVLFLSIVGAIVYGMFLSPAPLRDIFYGVIAVGGVWFTGAYWLYAERVADPTSEKWAIFNAGFYAVAATWLTLHRVNQIQPHFFIELYRVLFFLIFLRLVQINYKYEAEIRSALPKSIWPILFLRPLVAGAKTSERDHP
jgi:hypothetical protein